MPHPIAELLVGLLTAYLVIGAVFAVPFLAIGVDAIDPAARGASVAFRLLAAPGTVALWPLLLLRWGAGAAAPPVEMNAHRRQARRNA